MMKLTYLALLFAVACAGKSQAQPKDPQQEDLANEAACEALHDDSGFFVKESFEILSETEGAVTVTQFNDMKCQSPRQAFRVIGPVRTNLHKLASGEIASTKFVVVEKMDIAGWDQTVLADLNGSASQKPVCEKIFEPGLFVTVDASCLSGNFFARDAAKLLRLAVGNHYLFK